MNRLSPFDRPGSLFGIAYRGKDRLSSYNVLIQNLIAGFLFVGLTSVVSGVGQKVGGGPQMSVPDIQRFIALIERDIKSGESWKTQDGRYVALNYVDRSIPHTMNAQACANLMDRAMVSDCTVLRLPVPEQRIPVYLFPTTASLNAALGRGGSQTGASLGSWAVIVSKPNLSYGGLGNSAAHELGHAIVHERLGLFGCPLMAEGIAYYLEARFENAKWLADPRPLERTPLTSLLMSSSPQNYLEGANFCAYLMRLDNNDPSRIKAVLRQLHQARLKELRRLGAGNWLQRANAVFVNVYGKGISALESDWRVKYGTPTRT